MSVLLAFTAAALFGIGTWLLLQRRLTRIIIGIGLLGHGTNLLLITSGGEGGIPPLIGRGDPADFSDPLPQALALTAIVITFGVTAFLLAMAYRSWQLTHDDVVADDIEDRLVATHRRIDLDVADAEVADLEHAADSADPDDIPAIDADPLDAPSERADDLGHDDDSTGEPGSERPTDDGADD